MWKKYWYAWLNFTLLLAIILPGIHTQARATNAAFLPGFPKAKIGTMAFGSPTVADLDGDGTLEILTAGYGGCVRAWHADGSPVAGYPLDTTGAGCTGDRINGPLAVADINNDGILEIAAGTRGLSNQPGERGKVYIWQANGTLLPGWPQEMDWNSTYSTGRAEVYSVAFGRMLSGNQFQVVAGTSNNAANNGDFNQDTRNLYAWNPDGTLLPGYPTWYRTAGIWGQVGVADLTGDGLAEAITGRDHMYMHAYDAHGTPLPNWPVHTYVNINQTTWGVHPYIEFTRAAPAIADINRDGQMDIVTTGHIRDPQQGYNVIAAGILVIQADGTRLPGWEVAPTSGAPLYPDYPPSQAPSVANLRGDSRPEIVTAFFDGTLRVYNPDGSLWWQYDYAQGHTLFASEVAIGDINGDGQPDLVFGTYSPDGSANQLAAVHALSANGTPLPGFPLPLTAERGQIWGVRAAPTLVDLDGDCTVEIAATSMGNALYVWDLPAPYYPNRMPWPTSRQNNLRNGQANGPALHFSACPAYMPPNYSHHIYLPFLVRP